MQPMYRLGSDTPGIVRKNGHPTLMRLPAGAIVIVADTSPGNDMIDVYWGEEMVTIFTQDLDERGILEPGPKRSESQGADLLKSKSSAKTA